MSVKAMTWVWDHSKSKKNERLVLLAIADCASEDGSNAYPSIAELMRKTGLSERGVQGAIGNLVRLGELFVAANAGPRGCNRYRVIMHTPQNLPPAESAGSPAQPAGCNSCTPQNSTETPAESAGGTKYEPSEKNSPSGSSTRTRTHTRTRGTRIPDDFPVTEPMREYATRYATEASSLPVTDLFASWLDRQHLDFVDYWHEKPGQAGVKVDWLRAWQRWMRKQIDEAGERWRAAPAGARASPGTDLAPRGTPRPSTTDQRVGAALALAAEYDAQEGPPDDPR